MIDLKVVGIQHSVLSYTCEIWQFSCDALYVCVTIYICTVSPDDQQSVDLVDMLPNNMIIPSGMLKFLGNIGQGQ